MKNQLDLIVSLSALVIALILAVIFFTTARKPNPVPAVQSVTVTPVKPPAVGIEMMNGIGPGAPTGSSVGAGSAGSGRATPGRGRSRG